MSHRLIMALKQTYSYSRYMSPSRNLPSSPVHNASSLRSRSATSSPTRCLSQSERWKHNSVSTANLMRRSVNPLGQVRHLSNRSHQADAIIPTSDADKTQKTCHTKDLSQRTVGVLSSDDLNKWHFPHVDLAVFAKLVSSLNIEIPKYVPNNIYHRLLPNSLRMKSYSKSSKPEDVELETEKLEINEKVEKTENEIKVPSSYYERYVANSGQHDFAEAMKSTQESIQTFCSSNTNTTSQNQMKNASTYIANVIPENKENFLMRPLSAIRQLIPSQGSNDKQGPPAVQPKKMVKRETVAKTTIDRRTRALIMTLRKASSNSSRLSRLEDLCRHLVTYPDSKNIAHKEKTVPTLLRLRMAKDPAVRERAQEALGLIGYIGPIKARGVKVLSIDGGGTRGLMAIELLRQIEELCGARIPDLFDYVCGVSTGSLIAALISVYRVPLDECEHIYKEFSKEMFNRSRVMGAGKLVLSHAYYDGKLFEDILRSNLGDKTFAESMRDKDCPKEKTVPTLLRLRMAKDPAVRERAQEALGLIGYIGPIKARGVKVLSIDGGGTRGLMAIELLRQIEELCGARIPDLFDYVCGVSTGSLIAALISVYRVPLDECEHIYKEFSKEMFNRSRVMGAGKLVLSHAYYDGKLFEDILRSNLGDKTFAESMRDKDCPKLSAVSALSNVPIMQNHLFRNYTYPQGTYSHYPGSVHHHFWQAVRASSAAPGYYEEFQLGDNVHTDGGLLTNNPTAIALHEVKMLWPSDKIQCVVSLGTGRFRPKPQVEPKYGTLKDKIAKIVQSATDTEAVHTMLQDLLDPSTYFRFNPYMSEELQLDETNPEKWEVMKQDTLMYCRKNQHKLDTAAEKLLLAKLPHQKAMNWLDDKKDMYL
jgi:calcium-independent phospholipase A2-gamma